MTRTINHLHWSCWNNLKNNIPNRKRSSKRRKIEVGIFDYYELPIIGFMNIPNDSKW